MRWVYVKNNIYPYDLCAYYLFLRARAPSYSSGPYELTHRGVDRDNDYLLIRYRLVVRHEKTLSACKLHHEQQDRLWGEAAHGALTKNEPLDCGLT